MSTPFEKKLEYIQKSFVSSEDIQKSKSGIYKDNAENRSKHRVGMRYGKQASGDPDSYGYSADAVKKVKTDNALVIVHVDDFDADHIKRVVEDSGGLDVTFLEGRTKYNTQTGFKAQLDDEYHPKKDLRFKGSKHDVERFLRYNPIFGEGGGTWKANKGKYKDKFTVMGIYDVHEKSNSELTKGEGSEGQANQKVHPDDYVKSLGADKWNAGKLKREMDHHKSMAKITGDAGHIKVYENLSKMHKDHYTHKSKDSEETKELAKVKSKDTKAANAKKKKANNKKMKASYDKKQANKKLAESHAKKLKKAREAELLGMLNIDIEKAGKAGLIPIKVQAKKKTGKVYTTTVYVSPEEAAAYKKTGKLPKEVNKNAKVGGANPVGAVLNTLIMNHAQKSGMGKGAIMTELANFAGYGVTSKGTKASDPKSNINKIIANPNVKVPEERQAKMAEYFGLSVEKWNQMVGGDVAEAIMEEAGHGKSTGAAMDALLGTKVGEFNYEAIAEIASAADIPKQTKAEMFIDAGMRQADAIQYLSGIEDYYDVLDMFDARNIEHKDDDGFDMNELEKNPLKETRGPAGRFAGYRIGLSQVANGDHPFLVSFGEGGIGKTYNAQTVMREKFDHMPNKGKFIEGQTTPSMGKNSEEYEWVKYGGKAGIQGMVKMMFEHRDKIIIFDDFDSVIEAEGAADILKNALDPDAAEGERMVTYKSVKLETDDGIPIPSSFAFTGKCVFITNLKEDKIPQPILDRAKVYNLAMNRPERMAKISTLWADMDIKDADGKTLDIPFEIRKQAWEFMQKNKLLVRGVKLTPRAFGQLAKEMKNISQMSEKQLQTQFETTDMDRIAREITAAYFRIID